MLSKLKAYWSGKASNIHGVVVFLSGSGGITALELLKIENSIAKFVSGACMLLGAFLFTPNREQ